MTCRHLITQITDAALPACLSPLKVQHTSCTLINAINYMTISMEIWTNTGNRGFSVAQSIENCSERWDSVYVLCLGSNLTFILRLSTGQALITCHHILFVSCPVNVMWFCALFQFVKHFGQPLVLFMHVLYNLTIKFCTLFIPVEIKVLTFYFWDFVGWYEMHWFQGPQELCKTFLIFVQKWMQLLLQILTDWSYAQVQGSDTVFIQILWFAGVVR